MLNNSEIDLNYWVYLDGVYKGVLLISCIVVTSLFLRGLARKHALIGKAIGIEIILIFLIFQVQIAGDCFDELGALRRIGGDADLMLKMLRLYFYSMCVVSIVSLYKLLLMVLLLVVEGRRVRRKG